MREPYGLVEQGSLTVVEWIWESERVPSVPYEEQRRKTLRQEEEGKGYSKRDPAPASMGCLFLLLSARRRLLPRSVTQVLYPTAFGARAPPATERW
jgi:hypothetical protein